MISKAGDFININFQLDFEFSLVQEGVYTRGFYLNTIASADFAGIAGFNFRLTAIARGSSAAELASNPMAVLQNSGIAIAADVNLPFGIGAANFAGELSPSKMALNASVAVNIAGCSISTRFFLLTAATGSQMSIGARTSVGPFAELDIYGSFSSSTGLVAQASLDVQILFFRMTGRLDLELTQATSKIDVQAYVGFCGLGSISFGGGFSRTSVGTSMYLSYSANLMLMGFSVGTTMYLEYTTATGIKFLPSLTIGLPNPFGSRTFGYLPPSQTPKRILHMDIDSLAAHNREAFEQASGWSFYLTNMTEHVKGVDPVSRVVRWQPLANASEIRNASLHAMQEADSRAHRIARSRSSPAQCSPLEFSCSVDLDIGIIAFAFELSLSTADTSMAIGASARILGLTVSFSGWISRVGFGLSGKVALSEFSLFGLGTLSAEASFFVNNTADGATIGVGGKLTFVKSDGRLARWLLSSVSDRIEIAGNWQLSTPQPGEQLKVILDFRIPYMPSWAPSWAKAFCLEATTSSISSSQACPGMSDPNAARPDDEPCERNDECQSKYCQPSANTNEPDRCKTMPTCMCPPERPLCHNNEYCWKSVAQSYNRDPCGYGPTCSSDYTSPTPPPPSPPPPSPPVFPLIADPVRRTYENARQHCELYGGTLAAIYSGYQNTLVRQAANAAGAGDVWLGGNDINNEKAWKWPDGTPFIYINWKAGEPSHDGAWLSDEDCLGMFGSGEWYDLKCDTKLASVCEGSGLTQFLPPALPSPPPSPPRPPSPPPPSPAILPLVADPVRRTYDDARQHCALYGGTLAAIYSSYQNTLVRQAADAAGAGDVWLGGNDIDKEAAWKWPDGTPFAYINWKAGEPSHNNNYFSSEDCLGMFGTGEWYDLKCDTKLASVCEGSGLTQLTPPPSPSPPGVCICNEQYPYCHSNSWCYTSSSYTASYSSDICPGRCTSSN